MALNSVPARAYHADSDADDEYERSEITSPILPMDDDDDSTTNSDPPSTEPTPTFDRTNGDKLSPTNSIIKWTTGQCADFVASLDLPQYCDTFIENEIVGEALIALKHEELKEMNVVSIGHQITILKAVYDVKVRQEVPIESDHYIPPSAGADESYKPPSEADYNRLIKSIMERDERIIKAENALMTMSSDVRRLREEVLPIIRMAKDRSHPLPYHPNSHSPDLQNHEDVVSPMTSQMPTEKGSGGSSLSRKFSTKRLWLGNTPKSSSPTHTQQSIPENRSMAENANLDPSAAAVAASSHLTASISGGPQSSTSPNQANIPSPTSPNTYANQPTLSARAWNGSREAQTPSTARTLYHHAEDPSYYTSNASTLIADRERNASNPTPTPNSGGAGSRTRQPLAQPSTQTLRDQQERSDEPGPLSSSSTTQRETPSVEIFKSFRVSMEDPCHKVLPAALKKYNINADWRQYALYIVFGDQERCLGMEEKPLILFKQLDREGRKPMFMLRRHAAPVEGHSGPAGMSHHQQGVGSMGWDSGPGSGGMATLGSRGGGSSIQLPGGITHSEWASEDAYSASAGSGVSKSNTSNAPFKRLPFNFCAISLQPFHHPVCSPEGTIFDITNILPWLKKHGTNPVTGPPLKSADLIKLQFGKNDDGEMVDPVTFKVFTDNTHLVALKNTGNVFAYDTIERLNIKAKNWRDLISEEEFSRKDIITLQDPQNVESRNLSSFKYLKEGADTATPEQQCERNDPTRNVNAAALGNGASILRSNSNKKQTPDINPDALASNKDSISRTLSAINTSSKPQNPSSSAPTPTTSTPSTTTQAHHALHTTGLAAASLTSTGLTPHTTADLATLSQETYLLHPRRVRQPAYVLLSLSLPSSTTTKNLTLELLPEFAPKACFNFLSLAKSGYYDNTPLHRNIPGFMVQGGDPTGTGKGGRSCWNRNFEDEFDGPRKFDRRGVLAMANKGKNTNGSQFFVTYRACKHLERKHTIFGRVVEEDDGESMGTLKAVEGVETDGKGRPVGEGGVRVLEAKVLVDCFEEFLRGEEEKEQVEKVKEEIRRKGGEEDERVTWTGKRVRGDGRVDHDGRMGDSVVGKYIAKGGRNGGGEGESGRVLEEWEGGEEQPKKKVKGGGGFGNFDNW
ncbi:MAG: hypothetical protein LQ338_005865 [Usnochroma carphineum]|nr:MAG: hypothetical protein LQ338_005865 [Usnochroma carphineum]